MGLGDFAVFEYSDFFRFSLTLYIAKLLFVGYLSFGPFLALPQQCNILPYQDSNRARDCEHATRPAMPRDLTADSTSTHIYRRAPN